MNILLTLCYNGAAYHGFQVQSNALSVCEVLQDAMQEVFRCRPDVKGCSRTDAGVHAETFYVNFWHDTAIPLPTIGASPFTHTTNHITPSAITAYPATGYMINKNPVSFFETP